MDKDVQKMRFVPEVFPVTWSKLPALQVEQVKKGYFEAIYEDNVWKLKPTSNDQKWKLGVEYLFVKVELIAVKWYGMD